MTAEAVKTAAQQVRIRHLIYFMDHLVLAGPILL